MLLPYSTWIQDLQWCSMDRTRVECGWEELLLVAYAGSWMNNGTIRYDRIESAVTRKERDGGEEKVVEA